MPKPYPVQVTWRDAHHPSAGTWVDNLPALAIGVEVVTVGLLLSRNRQGHVLVAHSHHEGAVTGVFAIPRSCVVWPIVKLRASTPHCLR